MGVVEVVGDDDVQSRVLSIQLSIQLLVLRQSFILAPAVL